MQKKEDSRITSFCPISPFYRNWIFLPFLSKNNLATYRKRSLDVQSKSEVGALNIKVTNLVFSSIFHSAAYQVNVDMGHLA